MREDQLEEYLKRALALVKELFEPYERPSHRESKKNYLIGYLEGGIEICRELNKQDK